jgi:hypothetical protein
MKRKIFLQRGLDDANHVESSDEIRFCAQGIYGVLDDQSVPRAPRADEPTPLLA